MGPPRQPRLDEPLPPLVVVVDVPHHLGDLGGDLWGALPEVLRAPAAHPARPAPCRRDPWPALRLAAGGAQPTRAEPGAADRGGLRIRRAPQAAHPATPAAGARAAQLAPRRAARRRSGGWRRRGRRPLPVHLRLRRPRRGVAARRGAARAQPDLPARPRPSAQAGSRAARSAPHDGPPPAGPGTGLPAGRADRAGAAGVPARADPGPDRVGLDRVAARAAR